MTELSAKHFLGLRPFSVLFVCTGNICRSPTAEQVFRAHLDSPAISYSSAGTRAAVGQSMPAMASDVSLELGGNPDGHKARQLSIGMIEESDLVIALAREHRREVVRTVPRASRYTFTLREFVRLLEGFDEQVPYAGSAGHDVAGRLRSLVPEIASRRGYGLPVSPESDDVDDPFGLSLADYVTAGEQIAGSLRSVLRARAALEGRKFLPENG